MGKKRKGNLSEDKLRVYVKNFVDSFEPATCDNTRMATTLYNTGKGFLEVRYSDKLLAELEDEIIKSSNYRFFDESIIGKTAVNTFCREIMNEKDRTEITNQIVEFITATSKTFTCVVPVTGIEVKDACSFGIVTFYPSKDKETVIRDILTNHGVEDENSKMSFTCNFAVLKVEANDARSATTFATSIVKSTLDVFQTLFGSVTMPLPLYTGDVPMRQNYEAMGISDESDGLIAYDTDRSPAGFNVRDARIQGYNNYIEVIEGVQKKKAQVTDVEVSILEMHLYNANRLISQGVTNELQDGRFTSLMSAVESLVEQKTLNQSIVTQVSENVAILIGSDGEDRFEIYKKMKKLYDLRSFAAHGEDVYISQKDLMILLGYLRRLVKVIADNFEGFNEANAIQKFVQNKKLFGYDKLDKESNDI